MKSMKSKTKINKKNNKKTKKQTKKKIQKGGLKHEEIYKNILRNTEFNFVKECPLSFELIEEFLYTPDKRRISFWSYESKMKPTDDFEAIFNDPLEWYKTKNPHFKILKRPTEEEIPSLPFEYTDDMYIGDKNIIRVFEYRFLVAQMIKDLLFTLYFQTMPQLHPNNNKNDEAKAFANLKLNNITNPKSKKIKEKIFEILGKIEINIRNKYTYIEFVDYMWEYLNIFTHENKLRDICLDMKKFLNKTFFTPFIILPTIVQIDFKKVINLMRAPLLNFRFKNKRSLTHNDFMNPCFEISHDLEFHCDYTHNILTYIYGSEQYAIVFIKEPFIENTRNLKKFIKDNINNLSITYSEINNFFIKIYELYNNKTKNEKQYAYVIFLFFILHEILGINIIIKNKLLDKVRNINIKTNLPQEIERNLKDIKKNEDGKLFISIENTETTLESLYEDFIKDLESILIPSPIVLPPQ